MLRRSRLHLLADYRTSSKISDEFNNVLNRSGWGFDHVAVDVGSLSGAAGRLTRDLIGQERDAETVKIIHKQITNVILRRIQPKKSLAIFIDGSEPLWKVRHMRLYPGKKFEGKFYRSAASPMVYSLEDKLRCVGPDLRTPPKEFIVSGPAAPGPVEAKLSAWMLDLATRALPDGAVPTPTVTGAAAAASASAGPPEVTFNDTFCLIGGNDAFLSALGATPFHNITTVTLQQGEMKSLSLSEALEWFAMDHLLKGETSIGSGGNELQKRLASVRTDIVLLYLMANGISATDLPGLGVNFKDLMEAYTAEEANKLYLFGKTSEERCLRMCPLNLERVLTRATRRTSTPTRFCQQSADYLEILLQTHSMICDGGIKNFRWTPNDNDAVPEKQPKIPIERFIGHLKHLAAQGGETTAVADVGITEPGLAASVDWTFALTGIETLLLSAPKAEMIDQIIPVFTKGHTLPGGVAQDIVDTKNVVEALHKVRRVLQVVVTSDNSGNDDGRIEHPAFNHYPTHYFVRTPGSRGPPPGWTYKSVNLGVRAVALGVRHRVASGMSTAASRVLDSGGVSSKNSLFVFHLKDGITTPSGGGNEDGWLETPCHELAGSSANPASKEISTLRVVTWNVQFSRHSGERTPLGRDGIDWCTSTRYVALAQTLEGLDADVIGMQEVEPAWCKYLSQQPWVREKYAMTCCEHSHAIQPWGVMLLVRRSLCVTSTHHANVPAFSGHTSVMPEVTVVVSEGVPVTVGSMHLLAPYNQNNISNRTTQLDNLTKRLRTRPPINGKQAGLIVMGDFNDCAKNYFTFPPEMGFKDAWLLLHPDEGVSSKSGHTIDGDRNPYAAQIIEKEFYGRADRVLFSSRNLQPIQTEIIGTTSVREMGITKQVDIDKDVPEYLYPSDHFGLLVEFQVV
ncbi:RNA editing exonuclease 2 [Trypanosoma brucei equiperdum]|uniref:RNA editing exonuclease 2 n=1 Tax=Trypanosoma brucei equiperdum TaxID=630700 RepID=A0A3L6KZ53_9TRYP|nr:RNA editing exonuclease 2 [Trypanosoma brucei equiperdum]